MFTIKTIFICIFVLQKHFLASKVFLSIKLGSWQTYRISCRLRIRVNLLFNSTWIRLADFHFEENANSVSTLEDALQRALDKEDYESAAAIRDTLQKKKKEM